MRRKFKIYKDGNKYRIHDKSSRKRYNVDNRFNQDFDENYLNNEY